MTELEIDATTVTEYQLAVLAIKKALLEHVSEKHFEELAFLPTITKEQGTDEKKIELKKFWKGEDNNHGLTQPRSVVNDGSVEGLYEVNCNEVHPKQSDDDITIVNAVAQKLYPLIPSISTDLFKARKKELRQKNDEAMVEERLGREEVDNANESLTDAMEIDGTAERIVEDIAHEEAEKVLAKKKKEKKKKEKRDARKKSSGDPKSHGSTPTENGANGRKETKKQKKKKNKKKRSSPEEGDEESSYESQSRTRSRSRQKSILRDSSKSPSRDEDGTTDEDVVEVEDEDAEAGTAVEAPSATIAATTAANITADHITEAEAAVEETGTIRKEKTR
ncbi:hypothetical protein THAOC_03672 [Thalassiosira oceanica]|uniref:Uncharacterized protein n=1 Tax=Thalassiosira oceanica TaxID=159749 RepID=K0T797_THAOC|nr:hypothetical protein THAOC_03672 [Thalassiosira oceanica]|eukprot:EJK74638.1 hypothetical protein THAOC_03672 [Thalassiosira oceanica]